MSEKVIIDGVDVSGCDRYNDFPCRYGETYAICLASFEQWNDGEHKYCKDRPDCYYKQLQRIKAENEGLKSTNDFVVKQLERRVNQLREYLKALEEIREKCNCYAKTEDYIISGTFNEFLELVFDKINEVLK